MSRLNVCAVAWMLHVCLGFAVADGDDSTSAGAIRQLKAAIRTQSDEVDWRDKPFYVQSLEQKDVKQARDLIWESIKQRLERERAEEMESREIVQGNLRMPFWFKVFGEKPAEGRSLYISMHGGGGAPKRVNDRQWENQKRLYQLDEGVYLVPRAPTDTWNLWHQGHIDDFFSRLIENMIVLHNVNPNRVYLMGYSAGGDGVFQLAPRMADRFAAVAMMAGHPNETSPLGLRNLPFTLHMGGRDSAYNRNAKAKEWQELLGELREADGDGYPHWVEIYPEKGHWMDREDAAAIPWMAKWSRRMHPNRVVWKQDDRIHSRFYWLAVDPSDVEGRQLIEADRDGQKISLKTEHQLPIRVRLNDAMLDLDQLVEITLNGTVMFRGKATRSIQVIHQTLQERKDPADVYSAEIVVLPNASAAKRVKAP